MFVHPRSDKFSLIRVYEISNKEPTLLISPCSLDNMRPNFFSFSNVNYSKFQYDYFYSLTIYPNLCVHRH